MQKFGLPITEAFFQRNADDVAQDLIGTTLLVDGIGGMIVETEAYDEGDPAAHCFNPKKPETPWYSALNQSMFLPGGHAYVCPGRHLLHLNLVCGESGKASAILVRALQPNEDSISKMKERRSPFSEGEILTKSLCKGPGCVAEALAISCAHDGKSLSEPPFKLFERDKNSNIEICKGTRIGITRGKDQARRYIAKGNFFISKSMPDAVQCR